MANNELLRLLPQANIVMEHPALTPYFDKFARPIVLNEVRAVIDEYRRSILDGKANEAPDAQAIVDKCIRRLEKRSKPAHYPVINVTGIILNTSLGRAPYAKSVVKHITQGISGYMRLAAHPETGKRFDRDIMVSQKLAELFKAESATFVNNNAAATYLVLSALAAGKEVIVSRGQLVEIGGKFRIPDVLAASGAKLVEVGTTNRTHLKDYKKAITERTGVILRVHTSNYRITGFASTPGIEELATLAHEHNLVCIDDIGSGQLIDFSPFGLPNDYPLSQSIAGGADIVCFSGDKLMGGVQCGIIMGSAKHIATIREHPLARAFRVDKMTVLGLEATVALYENPQTAMREIPVLRMLATPLDSLKRLAQRLKRRINPALNPVIVQDNTFVGGGSLPDIDLKTVTIRIKHPNVGAEELAELLRTGDIPVFPRVADDAVILDLRTLQEGEDALLLKALETLQIQ